MSQKYILKFKIWLYNQLYFNNLINIIEIIALLGVLMCFISKKILILSFFIIIFMISEFKRWRKH